MAESLSKIVSASLGWLV